MAPPVIAESPPEPMVVDLSGLSVARNFTIIAGSQLEALDILKAHGVRLGAAFASIRGESPDASTVCQSIEITPHPEAPIGGKGKYDAKAQYRRFSTNGGGGSSEALPGGPPIYRLLRGIISSPFDIDANGNPVVNTVLEPIDPPLTKESPTLMVRVEWFIRSFNTISLQASLNPYSEALNSASWRGFPKESLLSHGVELADELDDGWVKLIANFEYRKPQNLNGDVYLRSSGGSLTSISGDGISGWMAWYVNRGNRHKTGTDAKGNATYSKIDEKGTSGPFDLDKDGGRLGDNAKRIIIVVPAHREKINFASLGI